MKLNKEETCIIAPAKLNLNLHVISKDIDGYHLLKSHVCFLKSCFGGLWYTKKEEIRSVCFRFVI